MPFLKIQSVQKQLSEIKQQKWKTMNHFVLDLGIDLIRFRVVGHSSFILFCLENCSVLQWICEQLRIL